MESRLRNDVLREAGAMGGRLLVARELIARGRALAGGEMEDDFEPVSGAPFPTQQALGPHSLCSCARSQKHCPH